MLFNILTKFIVVIVLSIPIYEIDYKYSLSAPEQTARQKKQARKRNATTQALRNKKKNIVVNKIEDPQIEKVNTNSNNPSQHETNELTNTMSLTGSITMADSELCNFAKKNDVLSLKRELQEGKKYEKYIDVPCSNEETLLMIAVKNDNYLTAKYLLEKGADVNIPNVAKATPLHIICRSIKPNSKKIFKMLLKSTFLNKNEQDMFGYTPLMRAVEFENIDFVEELVALGVDTEVKNNYGETALSLAEKAKKAKKIENEIKVSNKIIKILKKEK